MRTHARGSSARHDDHRAVPAARPLVVLVVATALVVVFLTEVTSNTATTDVFINVGQMARAGGLLNLVGVILTALVMFTLAPLVFGL